MTRFARVRALVSAAALAAVGSLVAVATVLAGSGPGPFPK
jgi:hypothetical protein